MAIYSFEGKVPRIDQTAYVHETADITGDVVIGRECYVGAGVILRADDGSIRIGPGTAVSVYQQ
jgi:carbonic anhydrase/acetyltransferase-like protein (isoleucine patch superfamily)